MLDSIIMYPPKPPIDDISSLVKQLPTDIKNKIYTEHFCNENKYKKLKELLESRDSCRLNLTPKLKNSIKDLLEDTDFIDYLLTKDKVFKDLYEDFIINKKRHFIRMEFYNDFATSWLFTLYH